MNTVHPGRILKQELVDRELSVGKFASALHVPSNHISAILKGNRGISPETALRLSRYFGNDAQFWMNLQTAYDLATTERALGERIDAEIEEAT